MNDQKLTAADLKKLAEHLRIAQNNFISRALQFHPPGILCPLCWTERHE